MDIDIDALPRPPACTGCGQFVKILAVRVLTPDADIALCAPCMLASIDRAVAWETAAEIKEPEAWKTMSFTGLFINLDPRIASPSSASVVGKN